MITSIFKNIGKGIGYFFLFPILLTAIAIYCVFGIAVFIFQLIKLIVLFFSGRNLSSDLPEDIQVKAMLTVDEDEKKDENPSLTLYPSDSSMYTSDYSTPMSNTSKEEEGKDE